MTVVITTIIINDLIHESVLVTDYKYKHMYFSDNMLIDIINGNNN